MLPMLTKCGELSGKCEVDALAQFVELILSSSSDNLARISHLLGRGALSEQHQAECDGSASSSSVAILRSKDVACAAQDFMHSRAPSCVVSLTSVPRVWPRTLIQLRGGRSAGDNPIRSASSYVCMVASQTQRRRTRRRKRRHTETKRRRFQVS